MTNPAEKAIAEKLSDDGWTGAYWMDEIKEQFPDVSDEALDDIYAKQLREKIDGLPMDELRRILSEQESESSANQNFFLQELIEAKLNVA